MCIRDRPEIFITTGNYFADLALPLALVGIGGSLNIENLKRCLLYTSPSPRDRTRSRMPSSACKKKNKQQKKKKKN